MGLFSPKLQSHKRPKRGHTLCSGAGAHARLPEWQAFGERTSGLGSQNPSLCFDPRCHLIASCWSNVLALAVANGRRLAVKIVARSREVNGPAILMTGSGWKYSTEEQKGWEQPDF